MIARLALRAVVYFILGFVLTFVLTSACANRPRLLPRVLVWLQMPKVTPWLQQVTAAYMAIDTVYRDGCVPEPIAADCAELQAHRLTFQSAAQGLLIYTRPTEAQ